jgi:hypothetical protein
MKSSRLRFLSIGLLVLVTIGFFGYKLAHRSLISDGMDPSVNHVRQLLIGIRQFVLDRQHDTQQTALVFPETLDALSPDYFSDKDLRTLLTPPVEYVPPQGIPDDSTIILILRAERGRVEGRWNGDVRVVLNNK